VWVCVYLCVQGSLLATLLGEDKHEEGAGGGGLNGKGGWGNTESQSHPCMPLASLYKV